MEFPSTLVFSSFLDGIKSPASGMISINNLLRLEKSGQAILPVSLPISNGLL
jgi:hypothetical protein